MGDLWEFLLHDNFRIVSFSDNHVAAVVKVSHGLFNDDLP